MEFDDIQVAPGVKILVRDLQFTGIRSKGPGGQNVNKVATTAVLRYHPETAEGLNDWARPKVLAYLATRLSREGLLLLRCGKFRTFERNRKELISRLTVILATAVKPKKKRIPTRPGKAAVERRLTTKKQQGRKKQDRRQDWGKD